MSGISNKIRLRGFWKVEAHKPILMTDPEKVAHYAKDHGIFLHDWESGFVTLKEMMKLKASRYFKRIENAFFGGGKMWVDDFENHVTTEGYNKLLSVGLDNDTQITTWYVGLTDGTPTTAITNTAANVTSTASSNGWNEVVAYDEAVRQTWTGGTVSAGSIDNVGNEAVFTISTNSTTVGGAFLQSNSAKSTNAGYNTGTLYAAGAFSAGNKTLDDGDTLTVTATFTAADS